MSPFTKGSRPTPAVARLPDPTQHARRQREATSGLIAADGAELLYVSSIAGRFAVLQQADGTVLDQEIAVATDVRDLRPGDRVVRLAIPGKGDRDARGSFVAIGPVNPVRSQPTMTPGPAMGSGPSAISLAGEDDYATLLFLSGSSPTANAVLGTITWATPMTTSIYTLVLVARDLASARVIALGYWLTSQTTTQVSISVVGPLVAATTYGFSIVRVAKPPA